MSDESAADWEGPMQVDVQNLTGADISQVTVSHTWKGSTTSLSGVNLPVGSAQPFAIRTGSGSEDEWTVTFVFGGTIYYRDGKVCNVKEKDRTSGQTIKIQLLPPTTGWSIVMPLSGTCKHVSYDKQTVAEAVAAAAAAAEAGRSEPAGGVGATAPA